MRALSITVTKDSLLTIRRSKRWKKRMVYILIANKSSKYQSGRRSHIIYIGTTGKGGRRPATSAIDKASEAFGELHGVREIKVHIATCKPRKAMKTWQHLEASLLGTFWDLYFQLPRYNKKKGNKNLSSDEDFRLFRRRALRKIILQFAG